MNRDAFRSDEEFDFYHWLEEAKEHGLISGWEYEPKSFLMLDKKTYTETVELKTKTKVVQRHLHAEASYTPDFRFTLTLLGRVVLFDAFKASILTIPGYLRHTGTIDVWVDVKGNFNPHQNDGRFFSLVRKVMYEKHDIWVAKVIPFFKKKKKGKESTPHGLFAETFAPRSRRWLKNRKVPTLTSCGTACPSVTDFVKGGQS